jgi:hypothetical protein
MFTHGIMIQIQTLNCRTSKQAHVRVPLLIRLACTHRTVSTCVHPSPSGHLNAGLVTGVVEHALHATNQSAREMLKTAWGVGVTAKRREELDICIMGRQFFQGQMTDHLLFARTQFDSHSYSSWKKEAMAVFNTSVGLED